MHMATVHRLPVPPSQIEHVEDEAVLARFTRLLRLEVELGVAETRALIRTLVMAIAVAVPSAIALIASVVVLLAAALSPIFDARWEPLLIAGGGVALLALGALAWSWRKERSLRVVAGYSATGMFTRPNVMAPFHSDRIGRPQGAPVRAALRNVDIVQITPPGGVAGRGSDRRRPRCPPR